MSDFKAIIFDLDGTAMPLVYDVIPSKKVIEALNRAKEHVFVSCATGRTLPMLKDFFKALDLHDPCVISGGTQIIDPKTEEVLWEKSLTQDQVHQVIAISHPYSYRIAFSDEVEGVPAKDKIVLGSERAIYIWGATEEDAKLLQKKINKIDNTVAHIAVSWTKGRYDVHVTHKEATKQHAIEELITLLKVEKKDIIGVGDSGNDVPLFESVGFKVAMGNASELLKSKADYVTGSVDEDGLAQVIEKFILKQY